MPHKTRRNRAQTRRKQRAGSTRRNNNQNGLIGSIVEALHAIPNLPRFVQRVESWASPCIHREFPRVNGSTYTVLINPGPHDEDRMERSVIRIDLELNGTTVHDCMVQAYMSNPAAELRRVGGRLDAHSAVSAKIERAIRDVFGVERCT